MNHAIEVRDGADGVPREAVDFLQSLAGPTAFRLAGRDRTRMRAVSAMLHGNEPSGFHAVHALLRAGLQPAVDMIVLIGAVEAARATPRWSHRMLPGRRDLNRCFAGPFDDRDGVFAAAALELFADQRLEALVDLHNNTGHNPAYGVVPFADPPHIGLTSVFADRLVHSNLRLGSLIEAFPRALAAVTIECGRAGDTRADTRATEGLFRFASMSALPLRARDDPRMCVLSDPVRVRLRSGATVAFAEEPVRDADLTLVSDVDRHNFSTLDAGSSIGWIRAEGTLPIEARGADGVDVTDRWFARADRRLITTHPFVPIMMTTNAVVATLDCLFYVVHTDDSMLSSCRPYA